MSATELNKRHFTAFDTNVIDEEVGEHVSAEKKRSARGSVVELAETQNSAAEKDAFQKQLSDQVRIDETAVCRHFGHEVLKLEWWERDDESKMAKAAHTRRIDDLFDGDRETVIFMTTLRDCDVSLEANMFPYSVPSCIRHMTLWSRRAMTHLEIVTWVDQFIAKEYPRCKRWQYDDNLGNNSILIFHVHVFLEMEPYGFEPRPSLEYFPPHCNQIEKTRIVSDTRI